MPLMHSCTAQGLRTIRFPFPVFCFFSRFFSLFPSLRISVFLFKEMLVFLSIHFTFFLLLPPVAFLTIKNRFSFKFEAEFLTISKGTIICKSLRFFASYSFYRYSDIVIPPTINYSSQLGL